jgi:hypothetical protein
MVVIRLYAEAARRTAGFRVGYLPTEQDLGVIVEIFSGDPAVEQKPNAT